MFVQQVGADACTQAGFASSTRVGEASTPWFYYDAGIVKRRLFKRLALLCAILIALAGTIAFWARSERMGDRLSYFGERRSLEVLCSDGNVGVAIGTNLGGPFGEKPVWRGSTVRRKTVHTVLCAEAINNKDQRARSFVFVNSRNAGAFVELDRS